MDKRLQAKRQRRGQPGNSGQFASDPSRQADPAPAHEVRLDCGGAKSSTRTLAVCAVPGELLPGPEIDSEVWRALADWNHDGPSRSIAKRLSAVVEEDIAARLSKVPGLQWIHGTEESERGPGQVYWDCEGIVTFPQNVWSDPDNHVCRFNPLEVDVGFSEFDVSKGCFVSNSMTATVDGDHWRWKTPSSGPDVSGE